MGMNTRNNKRIKSTALALGCAMVLGSCFFDPEARPVQSLPDPVQNIDEIALSEGDAADGGPETAVDFPVGISMGEAWGIDLRIPQTFAITRPGEGTLTTGYESYFITGTSDPALPVYFEEEEIERQGTKGVFGVLVELEEGENTFVFRQGEEFREITILRSSGGGEEGGEISVITQSSMYPASKAGVKAGQSLPVSCIAPAGAAVTAAFGEDTVVLEQVVPGAQEGIAAVFRGELPLSGEYAAGETVRCGPVSYTLEYDGQTSGYQSTGEIYVAGEGADILLQVSSYIGFVYPDLDDLSIFQEKMKMGAVDYLRAQNNKYFELASGGYIPVDMVEIVEGPTGEVPINQTLDGVREERLDRGERYLFEGAGTPAYHARLVEFGQDPDGVEGERPPEEKRLFVLTLYNTYGSPGISLKDSNLFEEVSVQEEETWVSYTFTLKKRAKLWGYNLSFDGGDLLLDFHYKPALSGTAGRPLEGIRFLIDPGHGGSDGGAMGLPGATGPAESTINLAHGLAVGARLEALGGEVVYTRDTDEYYSLDDRLRDIEEMGADFFLSVHHNSVAERSDANDISGMEIYYHDDLSQELADGVMRGLEINLDRKSRFVSQSYYRVTLLPYAPAVLMELGFMSNPLEYEKLTDWDEILQVADAVVDGVLLTLL